MERRELEKLKDSRSYGDIKPAYTSALKSKEHGEELRHFEAELETRDYYSPNRLRLHNFAARIGMLANMPLAEFLMELEAKIDRIADDIDNLGRDQ